MSANPPNTPIEIEPLISYPKRAEAGKSYVMTVDLRQRATGAEWPYEDEEYIVHFMLDSMPLFNSEPIGDPSVVLHRFGGTYGPAMFILTANEEEMSGNMRLTLVNEWGVPVDVIEIPGVQVTAEEVESRPSDISFMKESVSATVTTEARHETVEDAATTTTTTTKTSVPAAPHGFRLRHTLREEQKQIIGRIAWSPDGKILVVPTHNLQLWDAETGQLLRTLKTDMEENSSIASAIFSPNGELLACDHQDARIEIWETKTWSKLHVLQGHDVYTTSLSWSPDGRTLASCASNEDTVKIWDARSGKLLRSLKVPGSAGIFSVAWSPDGQRLASGSADNLVRIWEASTGRELRVLEGHTGFVYSVSWSPDGQTLASGGEDHAIFVWDAETGAAKSTIHHHDNYVMRLSFSADSRLLASKSSDGMVMLWRCDTWERLATLDEHSVAVRSCSPAFHPTQPALATVDEQYSVVRIWDLDVETLLASASSTAEPATGASYSYSTAKVVLLGDAGVGKSALAHRLINQSFTQTESTHGRQVWLFDSQTNTKPDGGHIERKDIFLWDLAGQPNYRLLHQLHLDNVAVALIVFDANHEKDLFLTLRYWTRALRTAERFGGPIRKILVSARADHGGISYRRGYIENLIMQLGFNNFVETSAREGRGIDELANIIRRSINWDNLPATTSSEVFYYTRDFLISEKEKGRLMATVDGLYRAFRSFRELSDEADDLLQQFVVAIHHFEQYGLLRRMRTSDYILLQPELIDSYAAFIINAVREDPEGYGSIDQGNVLECHFHIPPDERIKDREQERIVLIETIDVLLRHGIALSSRSRMNSLLIFPSLVRRENPELLDPQGKEMIFTFEGAPENIYATLAVSLSRSDSFKNQEMWRNVSTYAASAGGTCGIVLREVEEGLGELTLFFDSAASTEAKAQFEGLVHAHLLRHAIRESIQRRSATDVSSEAETLKEETEESEAPGEVPEPSSAIQSLKIYLSSGFSDLRDAAYEVIRKMRHQPISLEESPSYSKRPTGKQLEQLHKALLDAFSYETFELMLLQQMNTHLDLIVKRDSLSNMVLRVIQWAEAHGRLDELITKAQMSNPNNPELRLAAEQITAKRSENVGALAPWPELLTQVRSHISEADVYLCMVAWKYGFALEGTRGRSLTELEYERALELNKPIFAFLADEKSDLRKEGEASERLMAFRKRLATNHIVTYFTDEKDLEAKVASAIFGYTLSSKPESSEATTAGASGQDPLPPPPTEAADDERPAHEGMRTLSEVLDAPNVRKAIASVQSLVRRCLEQLESLGDLIGLHDTLHTLQYQYYDHALGLIRDFKKKPKARTLRDVSRTLEQSSKDIIIKLERFTGRPSLKGDVRWIRDLTKNLVRSYPSLLPGGDIKQLEKDLRQLRGILTKKPTSLNIRILKARKELSLSEIVREAIFLREELREHQIVGKTLIILEEGYISVRKLQSRLDDLLREFDTWGRIDVELKAIESTPDQDLSVLLYSVREIYRHVNEDWALSLESKVKELEDAMAARDEVRLRQSLQQFMSECRNRSYQVSTSLYKFCDDLRATLIPLNDLLNVTS